MVTRKSKANRIPKGRRTRPIGGHKIPRSGRVNHKVEIRFFLAMSPWYGMGKGSQSLLLA